MKGAAIFIFLALPAALCAADARPYGILLMAHGGDASWDAEIAALRAKTDVRVPTEAALGMADPVALQRAVDRLHARGVSRIVAVPLFVHTRSEVLDQTRYALGLRKNPSEVLRAALAAMPHAHGGHARGGHAHSFSAARVKIPLPLAMTPALDDDPLVSRILIERARALSTEPAREVVILVAHGPVDDAALPAWQSTLAALAGKVRASGAFKGAVYSVLRDDAAAPVRAAAVADLRAKVAAAAKGGRALVVPVLIARGGIEHKITRDLAGLDYAWDAKTLMPHEGFDAWVLARAAAAAP